MLALISNRRSPFASIFGDASERNQVSRRDWQVIYRKFFAFEIMQMLGASYKASLVTFIDSARRPWPPCISTFRLGMIHCTIVSRFGFIRMHQHKVHRSRPHRYFLSFVLCNELTNRMRSHNWSS